MKTPRLAILAGAIACQIAFMAPANAAHPQKDFEFTYNPSLLQTVDGRAEIRKSLKAEAHDFCRSNTNGVEPVHRQRVCRQTVIAESLNRISEKNPAVADLLASESASGNGRRCCT